MPFKIYTYEDPYKLDKADFWDEISALPHFCSARTLVNGLKDVLGDRIEGLICPLDELVKHEDVYMQWTDRAVHSRMPCGIQTAVSAETGQSDAPAQPAPWRWYGGWCCA